MIDILYRLRNMTWEGPIKPLILDAAADEIERLRARVAELERAALSIPDSDVGWDAGPDEHGVTYKATVVGLNEPPLRLDYTKMYGEIRDAGPTPLRGRITGRDRGDV